MSTSTDLDVSPGSRAVSRLPPQIFVLGAAWLLAIGVVATVQAVWGRSSIPSHVTGSLAIFVGLVFCTVCCIRVARKPSPARRGWTLMALAIGLAGLGQSSFVVSAFTNSSARPPPLVNLVAFLGYSIPILVALMAFPKPRAIRISRFRGLLDVFVITASVLLISEATILRRVREVSDPTTLTGLLIYAYPVADMAICSLVLCIGIRQRPGDRLTWLFLGAGLVSTAVTDSFYISTIVAGLSDFTNLTVAAGWILAPVLISIATFIPMTSREGVGTSVTLTMRLVPYIPALAAVIVFGISSGIADPFLFVVAAVLLAIVAVRQVMVVYENVVLTRDLEAKVTARTSELTTLGSIVTSFNDATIGISLGRVITAWNPAAEQLWGLCGHDVLGQPPSVLDASGFDRTEDLLDRAERGLPLDAFELDLARPDGSRVPVAMTVSPIVDSHGVQGISVYGQDITERRRSAAALEQAREDALESARIKSEFLATMSHEIRTPMNGVIGLTSLLLETPLNDGQRRYADGVRSAGEALLGVINDILDFSKLEAGKVVLDQDDFDPRRLVEEIGSLLAPAASSKGLELIAYCLPDVPRSVRGDPGRIRQILLNLASNAVKFTATGEVVVRVRSASESADSVGLRFEVVDTGIGIAGQDRARLFESFSQADASTTRRFGGTGLGLAISRRLIDVMGGEIGVDSQVGVGSTFWCEIPLRRGQPLSAAPDLPGPDLLNDLRVLVVDDNTTNRTILEEQLRSWNLQPDSVVDAEAALCRLRDRASDGNPYDLAALDMEMPEVDGLELARRIGADPLLRGMPLIMLTSSVQVPHQTFTDAGIGQWLAKPVRSSELYDRLVRLMAPREAQLSARRRPLRGPRAEPGSRGRILIVEDNDLNQLVAEGVLARLGFAMHTVADGLAALHALERHRYCAVLMDCHMPVLDGFAATREIRRREAGRSRMPIIAMTAGALPEDRQRCLTAGMDDYIAKPVDLDALESILDERAGPSMEPLPGPELSPPADAVIADDDPIDRTRLDDLMDLEAADGSSLLEAMVASFIARGENRLIALRRARDADDRAGLLDAAHELKGAAGTIGAIRVAALCRELETVVRQGERPAPRLLDQLGDELARANQALLEADLQLS